MPASDAVCVLTSSISDLMRCDGTLARRPGLAAARAMRQSFTLRSEGGQRTLVVALRCWPLATATRRPNLRLDRVLWLPPLPLPDWLKGYLLVELPVPSSSVPTIASPFRDNLAVIPSCLAVQGALAAIHGASPRSPDWHHAVEGRPAFPWHKPGGSITVSVQSPLWGADLDERALTAPWAVVQGLDDLDGDVLMIALAHAVAHRDPGGTTWITADAILDDRGIQPKTIRVGMTRYRAGHRREDRARVAACMERLGRLWIDLSGVAVMEQHGPRLRRGHHDDEGALLTISDRLVQGDGEDEVPVAWRYQPGSWFTRFLTRPNRQLALLARAVVRYDPYRQRWEKRLGRYLTFHLRMHARRGTPLVRQLGAVLEELHLPSNRRHPERTRSRCEAALDRLARDGVIGAWAYTAAAQAVLAALPARGWLDQWRGLHITVAPSRQRTLSRPEPDGIASLHTPVRLRQRG